MIAPAEYVKCVSCQSMQDASRYFCVACGFNLHNTVIHQMWRERKLMKEKEAEAQAK